MDPMGLAVLILRQQERARSLEGPPTILGINVSKNVGLWSANSANLRYAGSIHVFCETRVSKCTACIPSLIGERRGIERILVTAEGLAIPSRVSLEVA